MATSQLHHDEQLAGQMATGKLSLPAARRDQRAFPTDFVIGMIDPYPDPVASALAHKIGEIIARLPYQQQQRIVTSLVIPPFDAYRSVLSGAELLTDHSIPLVARDGLREELHDTVMTLQALGKKCEAQFKSLLPNQFTFSEREDLKGVGYALWFRAIEREAEVIRAEGARFLKEVEQIPPIQHPQLTGGQRLDGDSDIEQLPRALQRHCRRLIMSTKPAERAEAERTILESKERGPALMRVLRYALLQGQGAREAAQLITRIGDEQCHKTASALTKFCRAPRYLADLLPNVEASPIRRAA